MAANFIYQNRHGAFYFRLVIPPRLRHHFQNKREIRTPLKTGYRGEAIRRARLLWVRYQEIFERVSGEPVAGKKKDPQFNVDLTVQIPTPTGPVSFTSETGDNDLDNQNCDRFVEKHAARLLAAAPAAPALSGIKISSFIQPFLQEQEYKKIKLATISEKESLLKLFILLMGDLDLSEISVKLPKQFRDELLKWPVGTTKNGKFLGKSKEEILQMVERGGCKPRHPRTVNKELGRVGQFFDYLHNGGHIEKQIKFSTGYMPLPDDDEEDKGIPFAPSDLAIIFQQERFTSPSSFKPFRFWLPLIALHTGARLAEICQLSLADVAEVDGILCFCLTKKGEGAEGYKKSLKTKNAKRECPVHSRLIQLGFLDYLAALKARGESRVFPEAKPLQNGKSAGKWGTSQSNDFSRFIEKVGKTATLTEGVNFHSFRHTMITRLNVNLIPLKTIQAIVGHSKGSSSSATDDYISAHNMEALRQAVESLHWPELDHLQPFPLTTPASRQKPPSKPRPSTYAETRKQQIQAASKPPEATQQDPSVTQ